jgi:RimJ/RimL family protein N-acetyltransferase
MVAPSDPVLATDRLVVREWSHDDAGRLLDTYSRPDVMRFLGATPRLMESLDAAHGRIDRAVARNGEDRAAGLPTGWWAVEVRETGLVAGSVALVPIDGSRDPGAPVEVAWTLHPDSHGNGYATEAARAVLSRGHGAGITEILALTDPANTPSQAVCRRLDLALTGTSEEFYGKPLLVWVSRAAA